MKNIQLPDITRDRLLELGVDEEGVFVIPIEKLDNSEIENYIHWDNNDVLIELHSPLQKDDKFYIGEWLFETDGGEVFHNIRGGVGMFNLPTLDGTLISPDQMQPHQSRFQGECLSVEVIKANKIDWETITKIMKWVCTCGDNEENRCYFGHDGHFKEYYKKLVGQHNKLHNTNIQPSMDDYVFLIEVRRDK